MVGYYLGLCNIYPTNYDLYQDYFHFFHELSYQNIQNRHKKIYVQIMGGLGNQLFQIAAAYGIAKKHNRILIIVNDTKKSKFPHNDYLNIYFDTIFKDKNWLVIYNDKLPSNIKKCVEIDNAMDCFQYNDNIINTDEDVYLNGYFQCEKYFKNYKHEIIRLFKQPDIMKNLYNKYPGLDNSFFIHYRRGDYIVKGGEMAYNLDHDGYFTRAIEYIASIADITYAHVYIFSDDIEYCKQYPIFARIPNKTFVLDNPLNSLYLMSMCNLGGICSNSSFSWWGSYLNENPNKIVTFPKQWIRNGRYGEENDVYYENTILIDC